MQVAIKMQRWCQCSCGNYRRDGSIGKQDPSVEAGMPYLFGLRADTGTRPHSVKVRHLNCKLDHEQSLARGSHEDFEIA